MPESDVSFTFDTRQFENGINTIDKGMKGLKVGAIKMASAVAVGMTAATAVIGVFKIALKGARKVLADMARGMPELGKAFKIAKDIFMKNFLYPIRKAIMPMLQKMLDWVRDHRSMFVKWGNIVVGIFKTILQIGRKVVAMIRRIWESAARILSHVFGTEIRRINDLMNIMAFKISATIIFLSALLKPLFEKIGAIAETIAKFGIQAVKDFFEGFIAGAPGAGEAIDRVLASLKNLFDTLIDINEETGIFTKFFKTIGSLVGFTFVQALLNVEFVIQSIVFLLKKMTAGAQLAFEALRFGKKRDPIAIALRKKELKDIMEEEDTWIADWINKKREGYKAVGSALYGIWKPPEAMVEEKGASQYPPPQQPNVNFGGITMTFPPGTTQSQVNSFMGQLEEAVRDGYNKDLLTTGRGR